MSSDAPFLGRGWSFPPTFTAGGAGVETVTGEEDVHQSLRIILATTPGERVMQDTFGCDLNSQMFEEIDQSLLNKIRRLVSDALLEHEPRIQLDSLNVSEGDTSGCLLVSVNYTIRGTNSRFNMVYPFYLQEAAQPGL